MGKPLQLGWAELRLFGLLEESNKLDRLWVENRSVVAMPPSHFNRRYRTERDPTKRMEFSVRKSQVDKRMGIQDDAKRPIINWSILETGVNLVVRQPYSRTIAMILSGAPLPAPIFIGSATTMAPDEAP